MMLYLAVMLGFSLPSHMKKGHMLRQNRGGKFKNSYYFTGHPVTTVWLLPHGISLFPFELVLLQVELCHLKWRFVRVMAVGRKGRDAFL